MKKQLAIKLPAWDFVQVASKENKLRIISP